MMVHINAHVEIIFITIISLTICFKGSPERSRREKIDCTIFHDVVSTISYYHKLFIVYRDLEPENLVFCNVKSTPVIKLTDLSYLAASCCWTRHLVLCTRNTIGNVLQAPTVGQ